MSVYVLKGLRPWVIQRISAVLLALFIVYVAVCLSRASDINYEAWMAWLLCPLNTILFGLFSIALLFHAWVGMRDVVLDYIHHVLLRIVFLTIFAGTLIGCGIWISKILLLTTT